MCIFFYINGTPTYKINFQRRMPVLIFLSDGEHRCGDEAMYDICRSAVRNGFVDFRPPSQVTYDTNLRMPLSFHAVSFGNDSYTGKLRRMVQIAQEVEKSAPQNSLTKSIPSSFTEALDTASVSVIFRLQTLTCIS